MSDKGMLLGRKSGPDQSSSAKPGDKTNVSFGGEQNEEKWFERADHPLLNDVLLPIILEYVRGNDLKTCRSVNKKWNIMSIPFTRSRLQVRISACDYSFESKGIGKFMTLMRSNQMGIPFGRFNLGAFDTTKGLGQEFVQFFGNTTKELILKDANVFTVESISELFRSMPKLESYTMPTRISSKYGGVVKLFPHTTPKLNFLKTLNVENELSKENGKSCPSFYEELLGAAPNISTFLLDCADNDDICPEVLECLEKLGRESAIQGLRLPNINVKIFELLMKMSVKGMKLKELNFRLTDNLYRSELLPLFKNSLISLNIYDATRSQTGIVFPTLPKLVTLELFGFTNVSCENFTQTFPALEELRYLAWSQSNQLNNFITGYKSSTMKRLIIKFSPALNLEGFNRILSVFPALSTLECAVTEEDSVQIITKIWTSMTQLKGLHLRGCLPSYVNLDSLITGIPVKEIERMRSESPDFFGSLGRLPKFHRENALERMIKDFKGPSIRNLTGLRSLSLDLVDLSGIQNSNCLTELTAYSGLYTIKTLRHLYLSQCEFSALCCEVLVKDMDLMTWSFGTRFNMEHIIPRRLIDNDEYVYE